MDFETELLRAIMKALPDPVFVITESGYYLEIAGGRDPAYYHDGSYLKGLSLHDVLPEEKADWFLEQIRKTLKQDGLRTVKYSLAGNDVKGLETAPGPDGDIRFEGRIQPLPLTLWGERAVVWAARNITPQHELETKLQQLSETDDLTGIFNRRKFLQQLGRCFRRFKRYDRPAALVIFDIDYFKRINDGFGHSVGDDVLCRLTANCAAQLRQVDSLYRIGGEEFAVLLPETDAGDASRQAERLRQVSAQLRVEPGGEAGRVTISVGVSEFIGMDASIEDLMKRADAALYDAKRNGRNCVMITSENPIR
ncbi:MAG: GGDEF domain-containing protein [Desulfobacteraceae bacterium]|nr:GGDEF domain-containing protein [Desulfobacteraceae bacterium]